jgi:membrane-bound lytic murein transglycosylase B
MQKNIKRTCTVIVLAVCCPGCLALAQGEASLKDHAAVPSLGFQQFLQTLWPLAEQNGVSRATFDAALAELEPDPAVPAASERQAEFERPLNPISMRHFRLAASRVAENGCMPGALNS